jgi:hypothetical protein
LLARHRRDRNEGLNRSGGLSGTHVCCHQHGIPTCLLNGSSHSTKSAGV